MQAAQAAPDFTTLSPKQTDVLYRLLAGGKVAEVSRDTGVHRSTIYLWRQQPAFRALYQQACVNRALALSDKLDCLTDLAIDNVVQILSNQDHSPSIRLRAAKLVIDHALKPLQAETRQNSTKFDTPELFVPVESEEPAPPPDPEPVATPTAESAPENAEEPQPVPALDAAGIDTLINAILGNYVSGEDPLRLPAEPAPDPEPSDPVITSRS